MYELIFSNRVLVPSPGANFDAVIGFDLRTEGSFFTSSVPEPASLALLLEGAACLVGLTLWRRREAS